MGRGSRDLEGRIPSEARVLLQEEARAGLSHVPGDGLDRAPEAVEGGVEEAVRRISGGSPEDGDLIFAGKRSTGTSDSSLNERPKRMAMQLHRAGKVKNSNPSSWHSHPLRSSFETEGSHAGVPKQVRGYFEGHLADIMWVYNHRDEIYPEDLVREYQKIEPFVSLDPDEVAIRKKVEGEQSEEIQKLRNDVAPLTRAVEEVSAGRVKLMPPPGQ
jgi:hypothetical protein